MSIDVMSRVWELSPAKGGMLLAQLALADYADRYGFCFPGFATIGRRARMSQRQAQNVISELESMGEIYVHHAGKGGRHKSNEYIVCTGLTAPQIAQRLISYFEIDKAEAHVQAQALVIRRNNYEKISMKHGENNMEINSKERGKFGARKMQEISTDPSLDPSIEPPMEPSSKREGADAPAPALEPDQPNLFGENPDSHKQADASRSRRGLAGDRNRTNPAIIAYYGKYPTATLDPAQSDAIVQQVKDLPRWKVVLSDWKLNKWKAHSVGKMLNRYAEQQGREQQYHNGTNGINGINGTNQHKPTEAELQEANRIAIERMRRRQMAHAATD